MQCLCVTLDPNDRMNKLKQTFISVRHKSRRQLIAQTVEEKNKNYGQIVQRDKNAQTG